jgi:tartrate-resistant acid phosphatase type 5
MVELFTVTSSPTAAVETETVPTKETQARPTDTASPSVTLTLTPTPTLTPTGTPIPTVTATPTPLPPTPEVPVRFGVIGDYGLAGQAAEDVANLVKSWNPDFIITTGDNNYPNGSPETIDENIGQYYHEFIQPYKGEYGPGAEFNRFFPSIGNHDYYLQSIQPYLDYFELPGNGRYYDFVREPVHLFALNSDSREPDGVGSSSLQAAWMKDRLVESSSPWKIVYMHHSPYSSGIQGSVNWMRWPFKEWGVSAVLSAHDHTYERLWINDLPYFVNGLGGGPRYTFEEAVPGSQVRFRDDYGAMLVTATTADLTFEFYTRAGILIDVYSLDRSAVSFAQCCLTIAGP